MTDATGPAAPDDAGGEAHVDAHVAHDAGGADDAGNAGDAGSAGDAGNAGDAGPWDSGTDAGSVEADAGSAEDGGLDSGNHQDAGLDCADACNVHASCVLLEGDAACACDSGYQGDGFTCQDIDECAAESDLCDANASCSNLDGSYACACSEGFAGDGFVCEEINGCAAGNADCDILTECEDTLTGYECSACPEGYGGSGGTACIPQLTMLIPSTGRLVPSFAPTTPTYALTTGLESDQLFVTPSAPAEAAISIDGSAVASGSAGPSVALAPYEQATVSIELSAPNGQTRAYVVAVERNYSERAYLKPAHPDAFDGFGGALALDGTWMVVGASSEDGGALGIGGDQTSDTSDNSGAAYIFRNLQGSWQQHTYLKASNAQGSNTGSGPLADAFGASAAISGDVIVIGAPFEDGAASGVNGNQDSNGAEDSGAAYVFRFDGSAWRQEAYLKASNPGAGDFFGNAVAISGDLIAVGANLEDSDVGGVGGAGGDEGAINAGAVYLYRYQAGEWQFEASLKARYPDRNDRFGGSVAVDGDVVLVGALQEDGGNGGVNGDEQDESVSGSGAAYVFRRIAGTWQQEAYLKAAVPGGAGGEPTDAADLGDFFGVDVALRGDVAVVGAVYEAGGAAGVNGDENDDDKPGAGAAYVFRRGPSGWAQEAYLKASNPDGSESGSVYGGDRFGAKVALGDAFIAVAAPGEDSAARRVSGDQADNSAAGAGAVYVYRRTAGAWTQVAYVKGSNADGPTTPFESDGDAFGSELALSGTRLVVSAVAEDANTSGVHATGSADNSLSYSGAVYLFE